MNRKVTVTVGELLELYVEVSNQTNGMSESYLKNNIRWLANDTKLKKSRKRLRRSIKDLVSRGLGIDAPLAVDDIPITFDKASIEIFLKRNIASVE